MITFAPFVFRQFATVMMTISTIAAAGQADQPGEPGSGSFITRVLSTAAGERRYKIYIPGSYNGSAPFPLVVMLHGCTQDPDDFARGTRMNELAEVKSVLLVYPEQPASANPRKCWNWYEPAQQKRDEGEPALIAAITRQVMQDYRVDAKRVYVAGISAGAAMAVTTALSYPELFAAVASHSGIAYGAASNVTEALAAMQGRANGDSTLLSRGVKAMGTRARAMPAIVFQGASDHVVQPENAKQIVAQFQAVQSTAKGPHGLDRPVENGETPGGYHFTRAVHGTGDTTIEVWLVDELGHAWSGGSADGTFTDSRGPDATKEILRFFLEHPYPPSPGPARK
jgi:poly(hydroxyalkanoate) depolymerase family esterase